MKTSLVLVSLFVSSVVLAGEVKVKWLVEDCKFVTLNNAIRLAYAGGDVARVGLSPKSQEGPKSADHRKFHVVVLDVLPRGASETVEFGVRFDMLDPENGTCTLESDKVLTAEELRGTPLLPQGGDPLPGEIGRYWNPCSRIAVTHALRLWGQAKPSVPLVRFNSLRIDGPEKKKRVHKIFLAEENQAPITRNPARVESEELGRDGLRFDVETESGRGDACTIK